MAKINNLPATSYAKPHKMSGVTLKGFGKASSTAEQSLIGANMQDPNNIAASKMTKEMATPRVSMGDPARQDVKTTGLETRGNGCATKGRMARGPMA
jgi:hypothetical protein